MANEMPHSSQFTGLTQKVIAYSEAFSALVETAKQRALTDADWAPIEELVDVDAWERQGMFLGPQAETFGWATYKSYISQYGAGTTWEGTLRRVTETPGLVVLELEERNTHGGVMDVSNTVTIYEFNEAGKLRHLDVYIMPLEKR
ncbi:hypothetical protein [Novosphingobium sp. 9U]|uniref:hypothetical protein n=1 Tax=Novosphingobium sp. 9U TaxID=2653158 RepID=UPI0012EF95FC|nr:hypothetical protein [Novosphingobium sp. 9U]VWX54310.1 conserved hypothetical protein [Novosphingobium sp. 9U]